MLELAIIVALIGCPLGLWLCLRAGLRASEGLLERFERPDTTPIELEESKALLADLRQERHRSSEELEELCERVDALELGLKRLTAAVAEGIENVARSERRVRSAIRRAQERFDAAGFEDEGLEAEAAALPEYDEGSGGPEGVQTVLGPLEASEPADTRPNPWSVVPGMNR